MIILGLDASTPRGSVALVNGGEIIAESVSSSNYSDQFLVMIDEVLSNVEGGIDKVDAFCVTTGPGSFTGLRVGVSLIKGLVLATEKPFWGINTLEAFANRVKPIPQPISPILDARKKELYTASFKFKGDRLIRETPDQAVSVEKLCNMTQEPTLFLGSGLEPYGDNLSYQLGEKFIHQAPTKDQTIAASAVQVALNQYQKSLGLDLDTLNIHYVRKSEAEINHNKTNQEVVKHGNQSRFT